jgi:hypothetical protein
MLTSVRKSIAVLATLLATAPACLAQDDGPRLAVMITVDQLRGDLLDRYASVFTGGFARLAETGYSFTQANHAHAVTHTAAGPATLATGVFPSRSGIVANSWAHRTLGQWVSMYAVQDDDSPVVGVPELEGRSPKNLLRGGIADWILEADDDARVVSLSGKDRAAITMGGQAKAHVYWVDQVGGRFVTSEYYRNRYPGWVRDFNDDVMPTFTADTVWASAASEEARALARADSADYENDGVHTTMPHLAREERTDDSQGAQNYWAFGKSIDQAVFALARVAVEELDMGQRDRVDYLALSLSATDYVGHGFGPFSQEQLANLVRLDEELGAFFEYLDETVGPENWVTVFSADHGVVTMPEYAAAQGERARRIDVNERRAEVMGVVQRTAAEGGTADETFDRIAAALETEGLVAKAYTHTELTRGEPADSFAVFYRNSHYPGRAHGWLSQYGIELRHEYQDLVSGATGTTHGTPYWYDRHVPFIVMGAGVSHGSSDGRAYSVDAAPTLARLVGIRAPDDLDGRPIYPPLF